MSNYPKTIQDRAALYATAIHEIRSRLRSIDEIRSAPLNALVIFEFCQLQMRLCCECLAIACLAAQGNFQTHKAFRDSYELPLIFKALDRLQHKFFPEACCLEKNDGVWEMNLVAKFGDPIDQERVISTWQKSGRFLHRTSAKNMFPLLFT